MNLHALADRATAVLAGAFAGRHRFFARSLDGPRLLEAIRSSRVEALSVGAEGTFDVPVETPAGTLDAAFLVARWIGPARPTLLYLQGSGERPFDFSSRSKNTFRTVVLEAEPEWRSNLIVLRAPFHAGSQRDYARAMGELENFTSMVASLVVLADALIAALRRTGPETVVLSGISLGGWATNLHAAAFGSAGLYLPLLAGAALDDLFLRSSYRRLTGTRALDRPEVVRDALNFEDAFRDAPVDRVIPLLARHDQFVRYEPQARSYGDVPVDSIDRGHVTAAASPALLREHLHRHMP